MELDIIHLTQVAILDSNFRAADTSHHVLLLSRYTENIPSLPFIVYFENFSEGVQFGKLHGQWAQTTLVIKLQTARKSTQRSPKITGYTVEQLYFALV